MILGGETVDLILKEGQEPDLVDPTDQLLPAADAVRAVSIPSPHDPLAVLNGHGVHLPVRLTTGIIAQRHGECY